MNPVGDEYRLEPELSVVQRLADMTWCELKAGPRRTVVVPIGSLEQHGPHLPLATDTIIAEALATRLCASRPSTVLAPTVAISASGEHQGFAGTLSVGTEVTASTLIELARSADWSDGVAFINGHGGNAEALSLATRTIEHEGRAVLVWWPRIDGGDLHAGATETSLMLALAPSRVRFDDAVDGPEPPIDELRQRGVSSVSPSGVLGRATQATADHGRLLFEQLAGNLIGAFDRWAHERRG